ncbi:MAG: indolepyruvate oxidoreductase subunit beta family protein, partial [Gammaproteobacteria bacterium]|nr:indolepyruvate oxidoreductase subunit beta family protein [Gammaproteobacteria bacterium]
MSDARERPITIAMLALGGQGGGVLTGWLVETAEANGFIAQSTYVAGVAQRTGATVYCVEMFPRESARIAGRLPVFTPYPVPGDVDLVIAGEMAETGRAIEKGFVTPNVTTLVASSHRVYSMPEKEALGDGIMDLSRVAEIAAKASRRFVCFDMQQAADAAGSVISSVLFGAIAASGALPFSREACEEVIRQTGKAVDANLAGFAAGYAAAGKPAQLPKSPEPAGVAAEPRGPAGRALASRIDAELPGPVRGIALHGALRALDYQDARYAEEYLDRLKAFVASDSADQDFELTAEVARQLALQMCYEDTIRVADLKIRGDRIERIRAQVGAADDQPVRVIEYFHPRIEELCDTLPAFIAKPILRSELLRKGLSPFFRKGRNLTTTGISGFLALYMLSRLRPLRRFTYRYGNQRRHIDVWLDGVTAAACNDYDHGLAIARCIEIVRGYGETFERGMSRYLAMTDAATGARSGEALRRLHSAALADEQGVVFRDTLESIGAGA